MKRILKHSAESLDVSNFTECFVEDSKSFNVDVFCTYFVFPQSRKILLELNSTRSLDYIRILRVLSKTQYGVVYLFNDNIEILDASIDVFTKSLYEVCVDKLKKCDKLGYLLTNKFFLKKLVQQKILNEIDIKSLLCEFDWKLIDIISFFTHDWLLKYCLSNLIIDAPLMAVFNEQIQSSDLYKEDTFFTLIKYPYTDHFFIQHYDIDESLSNDILNIAQFYENLLEFAYDISQLKELFSIVYASSDSRIKLNYVAQNQIQSIFEDFDSLKSFLLKKDKKFSLNI